MKKLLRTTAATMTFFIVILLIICLISLIVGFIPYMNEAANATSTATIEKNLLTVNQQMDDQFDHLAELAEALEGMPSREAVAAKLHEYVGSDQFGDLQFVCQGNAYSESGTLVPEGPIFGIQTGTQKAISKVKYYPLGEQKCVALYLPVRSSTAIDGVISIIPATQLLDLQEICQPPSLLTAVVTREGETLAFATDPDFPQNPSRDFISFFKQLAQNKNAATELQDMFLLPGMQSQQFSINGLPYTVASATITSAGDGVLLVDISPSRELVSESRSYLQQAIVISIISILALVLSGVYVLKARKKAATAAPAAQAPAGNVAPADGHIQTEVQAVVQNVAAVVPHCCTTPEQFISTCALQVERTGFMNRYMVCAGVRDFGRLQTQVGGDTANNGLLHIEKVLGSICKDGEMFCYGGVGCFYIFLRCNTEKDLQTRSQLLMDLCKNNNIGGKKLPLPLAIGAYPLNPQKKGTIKDAMQLASLTKSMVLGKSTSPCMMYSADLMAERENNEKIEQQMEEALKTGEFKLFLQPKYNVQNDRIDSAEALVRWFDPRKNDYIFPGQFISLFESNGFITKLDHFMYLEVCTYLENAIEKGDKVLPICVNVSRVTALQSDFINFYVGKKKQHNIPDDMLTLEFMESFVMQNYQLMATLFATLKENGIRCSIDNFASGAASIGILKKLNVDDINIDRSFLFPGVSPDHDLKIQKALVGLAKDLGIRVVQSGVENKELFERCCNAGCDLIQGYYFARAISLEEYRIFIGTNTSIRYKAFVK